MPRYRMTSKTTGLPTKVDFRRRRDAAVLVFQWNVYHALEARGLLDVPIAHRLMEATEAAHEPECSRMSLSFQDCTLTYRKY